MKKYIKVYLDYFGYGEHSFIPCEMLGCGKRSGPPHHIQNKQMGGSKNKDHIDNLIGLCDKHHDWAHSPNTREKQERLKKIHLDFIKQFLMTA